MIHQQIAALDIPDRSARDWLPIAMVLVAGLSLAALGLWSGQWLLIAALVVVAVAIIGWRGRDPVDAHPAVQDGDSSLDARLIADMLGVDRNPSALSDEGGTLIAANRSWRDRFDGARSPLEVGGDADGAARLAELRALAWQDGGAVDDHFPSSSGVMALRIQRVGRSGDQLLWRLEPRGARDPLIGAARALTGGIGTLLSDAGVAALLLDADGRAITANRAFLAAWHDRGGPSDVGDRPFDELLVATGDGRVCFAAEAETEHPTIWRLIDIPIDQGDGRSAGIILLVEALARPSAVNSATIQMLLEMLPIGLALVDRDGRFLSVNKTFRIAAGTGDSMPTYPGDLVVKEDKGTVADIVRRHVRSPTSSTDLPVRLTAQPADPVALTVAGLRGLGEAAVLLLLKDNSEEAKLKRQIAQATKMQAVGQLAGGVAHDFNNILTAIIGHCDLMLMRHGPGDSDYDDIQQIRSNGNRAAALTRQLLAFSRQQTLRPQVLQLPDVVSEVSHLLKRLLGETVHLIVKHGRDIGPVRADPGQLEQVIVNLAVNARDAMIPKGGGTLTIHTYPIRAEQVADLGSDILPVADYSAFSVSDTGTGIAPTILGKVFEPFFTTKEVGKGTGLGLSTVYGIVKQSGGYIFADSKVGEGTSFTIYLPVHEVEEKDAEGEVGSPAEPAAETWGTGTILLVEDEPMVRTVAERALIRNGYQVITADNGEEALERLAEGGDEIILLISDVVMPLMDGPTMVREARRTRPDLPVLFMSGYAEEQLRRSLDIDNVDFLAKPFSVQELAATVRRVMGGK